MKILRTAKIFLMAGILTSGILGYAETAAETQDTQKSKETKIQIAILLDNSGSMNGLIDQARTYLWQVVTDSALAKKNGVKPKFEVALYHYGDSRLSSKDGYIKQLSPLTDDLDLISEKLFALTTSGGEEYCGQVIQQAVDELKWSDSPNDLKMIFIAGNEPFSQGTVKYQDACKNAIAKGIIVNTILCGNYSSDEAGWKAGAVLADGDALKLDHNMAIASIETPYDKEIAELNVKLNGTYIAYGANKEVARERQMEQDAVAGASSSSALNSRVGMKLSKNYENDSWDIVDAAKKKDFDIAKIKKDELPANMQKMTVEEQKKYIAETGEQREKIRKEMSELVKKQNAYIQEESKKTQNGKETLGELLINSTRKQAEKRGMEYEDKK